jgi:hypothetical protein
MAVLKYGVQEKGLDQAYDAKNTLFFCFIYLRQGLAL